MERNDVFNWARHEFGGARLGDIRRTMKLVEIACGLFVNFGCAISSCCGKMAAQLISRFFERPEVTVDSLLQPHIGATGKRCAGVDRIFAVQDTTHLDYGSHLGLEGLGPIGKVEKERGLLMHTVLAITPEKTPLGIIGMNIWTRSLEDHGNAKNRNKRPINEKDTGKWLIGLCQAESAISAEQPLLIIGDRGSDVFEVFVEPRRNSTDILIRSNQNRALISDEHKLLMDAVSSSDEMGVYSLDVPRQGSRLARKAEMVVRVADVTIKRPYRNRKEGAPLYCVWAKERSAPEGVAGLDWVLLTSLPVKNLSDALYVINAYSCRWVIEEFHKVLKSGCKVERLQFETLERLCPAIALLSVIAWRVLYLSKESRRMPDIDAKEVCDETERRVLEAWLKSQKVKQCVIKTLKDFVRGVAIMGGFMARKSDGNPGPKAIWQGLRRLEDLTSSYKLCLLNVMKD
jgi:hypothetical protein